MKNIPICSLFFLLITLHGCKENKSTNQNGNSFVETKVQEKEIIDTSTIYGYTINNYFIDSNQVEPNQGLSHLLPKYGVSQKVIFNIATNFNEIFDFKK